MPRECAQCCDFLYKCDFSASQWRKGDGVSRCEDCVSGGASVRCDECGKSFCNDNALRQHKRTHQPRAFACPGCNKMYRGLTDTALHFESGSCAACMGQDNARRAAYQLVSQQKGGTNFLTNPLMITDGGAAQGGYTDEGPNYQCPSCHKRFRHLSALMQHQQSTACISAGRQVSLRIGMQQPAVQQYKFFHGTTWPKADKIRRDGFIPSTDGCLGRGIYVAREDKATRFALLRAQETGQGGGLVEVLVSIRNPKMVSFPRLRRVGRCRRVRKEAVEAPARHARATGNRHASRTGKYGRAWGRACCMIVASRGFLNVAKNLAKRAPRHSRPDALSSYHTADPRR